MGFILGVLILGALLSVIFGKAVGQLFVLGTGTIVMLFFGVLLVLLSPLIWGFFTSKPTPSSSYSYQPAPAYGSSATSQTYAPVTQTPAASYQASSPPPATGTGPRLGIGLAPVPAYTVQQFAYLHVPEGAGAWIEVQPGSPAEAAGLKTYDVILSAGTQSQQACWIMPTNQLPDYLDRVGYNVPVRLHIYRAAEQRDFWVWVYPK